MFAEVFGEVAGIGKTAGDRNLINRHFSVFEELFRFLDSLLNQVGMRTHACRLLEQAAK